MSINPNICRNLEEQNPDVIDFQEAVQAKVSGSGGGYDHFTGMAIGTRFASARNANYSSELDEYVLLSKQGPTVLLQGIAASMDRKDTQERHIGSKFWKLNTLVQILHIPNKDNNDGNSVED